MLKSVKKSDIVKLYVYRMEQVMKACDEESKKVPGLLITAIAVFQFVLDNTTSVFHTYVKRDRSPVKCRTVNRESLGSNPLSNVLKRGQLHSPHDDPNGISTGANSHRRPNKEIRSTYLTEKV